MEILFLSKEYSDDRKSMRSYYKVLGQQWKFFQLWSLGAKEE